MILIRSRRLLASLRCHIQLSDKKLQTHNQRQIHETGHTEKDIFCGVFNASNLVCSSNSPKLSHSNCKQELHTFIPALTCLSHSPSLSLLWAVRWGGNAGNRKKTLLRLCFTVVCVLCRSALWRSGLPDLVILTEVWSEGLNWANESGSVGLCKSDVSLCVNKGACCFLPFLFRSPLSLTHSLYLLIRSLAFLPSLFQSNFLCHACLLYNSCCLAYGISVSIFLSLSVFLSENHDTLWFINTALVTWRDTSNIQGFF